MALDAPHTRPSGPSGADGLPFEGDEVLPCGRLLSQVWERARDTVADPDPAPHTASCPYCREAVEGLAALTEATRALCAAEDDTSALRSLTERVMDVVRAEVRLGRLLPLADPERDLRIAESAAAKVLRRAADTVPGARAAACRLRPEGEGADVRVTLTLAAALDRPLPDRVRQVRRSVLHSARHDLGLAVTAVDITVTGVLEPEKPLGSGPATGGGA